MQLAVRPTVKPLHLNSSRITNVEEVKSNIKLILIDLLIGNVIFTR